MTASRRLAVVGALLALTGVAAGAFGAHGLRGLVGPDLLAVFETGVRYQVYHALGLFAVAFCHERWAHPAIRRGGTLLIVGTLIFSGSLYLLTLSGLRWLGAITPIGGAALLAGWALVAWGLVRARD